MLACADGRQDDAARADAGAAERCEDAASDVPPACELACCGCLCADPSWSCAIDTCTDSDGSVVLLAPEAGFFELPIVTYPETSDLPAGASDKRADKTRMWYSFYPADRDASSKPLFVFIQGGPGSSIMPLWGTTAPLTVAHDGDPELGGTQPNPLRWSTLGNLLYIDSSSAGFSYERSLDTGEPACDSLFDSDQDAGHYVRVVLRFLQHHPALIANPIVLVAESYGGVRATLMLQRLLHPESLRDTAGVYQDGQLASEIEQHAKAVAAARGDRVELSPERMARQFGHQVLIEPVVLGALQPRGAHAFQHPLPASCPMEAIKPPADLPGPEMPHELTTSEIEEQALMRLHRHLHGAEALSAFVGVDITSIEWLRADARAGACRRAGAELADMLELSPALGALGSDDAYYAPHAPFLSSMGRNFVIDHPTDPLAPRFVQNLLHVRTFITNAECDFALAIEDMVAALPGVDGVRSVERTSLGERTDQLRVELADGSTAAIRLPFYPRSGHMVTVHRPELILEDVRAWLAEEP